MVNIEDQVVSDVVSASKSMQQVDDLLGSLNASLMAAGALLDRSSFATGVPIITPSNDPVMFFVGGSKDGGHETIERGKLLESAQLMKPVDDYVPLMIFIRENTTVAAVMCPPDMVLINKAMLVHDDGNDVVKTVTKAFVLIEGSKTLFNLARMLAAFRGAEGDKLVSIAPILAVG
jgi:hypothetical protein